MKKTRRSLIKDSLFLLVLFLILGGYYLFKMIPDAKAKENSGKISLLPVLNRDDIVQVRQTWYDKTNHYATLFVKADGGWMIQEPVDDQADPEAITKIFNDMNGFKSEKVLTNMTLSNIVDFGFDSPISTLHITMRDGRVYSVINGGSVQGETMYYTLTNGDSNTVFLVHSYKFTALEKKTAEFRKKEIFSIPMDELLSIKFGSREYGRFEFTVATNLEKPVYTMLKPEKMTAEPFQVKNKIMDFLTFSINDFTEEPDNKLNRKRFQLEPPLYSVIMSSRDGKMQELIIGTTNNQGMHYAAVSGRKELLLLDDENVREKFKADATQFMIKKQDQ